MPGAYVKQMCGEHYEQMVASVQKCEELLGNGDFELLRLEVPFLLLLQGDRSKKSIEEFCYAGGFRLMCRVLEKRVLEPSIGDVTLILNSFSALLAIEFEPCKS